MANLTYQYRIYPFGDQAEVLEHWLGACQQLYNAALEQRRIIWRMGGRIGYPQQQKELTEIRATDPLYYKVPVHVLQNVLLRLDRGYDNAFRRLKERKAGKHLRLGFPRFKAWRNYRSFTCPDRYNYIRDGALFFPKLDKIRMEMHRPLPEGAIVKTCTISRKADGWYASFSLDVLEAAKSVHTGDAVGIDVGLENFAALSTGEMVPPPKFLRKAERKLKRAQRVLSRRKPGSNRRSKQNVKLARLHLHVQRQRKDFCRKIALDLARKYSLIAVEDLRIRNMARNHRLSKSILDAAWALFIECIEHAVVKTGSRLVKVPARGTSIRCSVCDKDVPKTLADRWHTCPYCGASMSRDTNAAHNILKLGRDMPEVTLGERRSSTFRYKRKARSLVEPRTVLERANVA